MFMQITIIIILQNTSNNNGHIYVYPIAMKQIRQGNMIRGFVQGVIMS